MIKNNEPNPLNFFDLRRVEYPMDHFEYVEVRVGYNIEQAVCRWIETNLKGRFYIGRPLTNYENRYSGRYIRVGFEEAKESSYFTLACPHLKYT